MEDVMPDRKKTVFVVDDESVIAQTLAMILNQSGYAATAFETPDSAIAAAKDVAPDLLITDVVMPGMNGIDLAIHFRSMHPLCRVLLFSGQAVTSNLLEQARRRGYNFDVLAKPVHPADLLAKLQS
jgi:DNA-binding NtrC family response regulator